MLRRSAARVSVGQPVCFYHEEELSYIGRLENKQKRLDVLFKSLQTLRKMVSEYHR
jgi:hypothetical protein